MGFRKRAILLSDEVLCHLNSFSHKKTGTGIDRAGFLVFGAGNETRTRDIHVGNVMLYQLSYSRLGGSVF